MSEKLSLTQLRKKWQKAWKITPHNRIGRAMLEKSLECKSQILLSPKQQIRLTKLVKEYKRNSTCFDERVNMLKPGTRLVRVYQGRKHNVLVKTDGFEYQDHIYSSLSKIANDITGKHWNGWIFFGLKKAGPS
jgi:hypothetical protein